MSPSKYCAHNSPSGAAIFGDISRMTKLECCFGLSKLGSGGQNEQAVHCHGEVASFTPPTSNSITKVPHNLQLLWIVYSAGGYSWCTIQLKLTKKNHFNITLTLLRSCCALEVSVIPDASIVMIKILFPIVSLNFCPQEVWVNKILTVETSWAPCIYTIDLWYVYTMQYSLTYEQKG